MFHVAIWGTVANWVEAIFTGGAAVAAAGTYIASLINNKHSQARRVRAQFNPALMGQERSIKVLNDSDTRISGLYVLWAESTLRRFLLRNPNKRYPVTLTMTRRGYRIADGAPITFVLPIPLKEIRKKDFVGYHGGRGVQMGGGAPRFIDPGAEGDIPMPNHHQKLGATTYWVGFIDAKGRVWERAVTNPDRLGPLRKGRGLVGHHMDIVRIGTNQKRDPLRKLKYDAAVLYWLYKHRRESTSITRPETVAPPPSGKEEAPATDSAPTATPEAESTTETDK